MQTLIEPEIPSNENKLCKHLENYFINNYFSLENTNFCNIKKLSLHMDLSRHMLKKIYDNYFIKRIDQDWIAINNIYKSFQNNNIREGCIFTLQFDDSGMFLATSNRNHHYLNSDEHNIEIWDMQEKKLIKSLLDHKEIVTSVVFTLFISRSFSRNNLIS